jgi:lambda family phage tail tape measure protein
MPPAAQVRKITINVDAGQGKTELKAVADALGGMNKNTKSLADSFESLKHLAGSFLGGLGIHELVSFSDQIQTLNNRLLALTGDQDKATELLHKLDEAARDTNSSLQNTSDVFTRLSLALKDAGADSGVMIDLTKTLINTFRLSGSSAEEAAAKVTALAYGLQQGGLKGKELRTVLRENTELGNLLKKTFNGNILQAANNGFITTAALMRILHDNMGDVNARAAKLGATFEQSLEKVFDAFKVKVFGLNQALGASAGFARLAALAIDNMSSIVAVMIVSVPILASSVVELAISFGLLNEPIILVTALAAALLSTNVALAKVLGPIDQLNLAIYKFDLTITGSINKIATWASYLPGAIGHIGEALRLLTQKDLDNSNRQILLLLSKAADAQEHSEKAGEDATAAQERWRKSLEGFQKIKFDENAFQLLVDLNRKFDSGSISVAQYNDKLQQVNLEKVRKEFATGHANLEQLNESMDKFNLYQLNIRLRDGKDNFEQFDNAVRDINLERLNRQLAAGIISLEEYNSKIASVANSFSTSGAFRTGLQDYLTSIGTTTQQVAGLITNAFKNVEDAFISFTKTGKLNFAQFTQAVLDDLLRIIIRSQIIAPLARGLLNGLSAGSTAGDYGSAGGSTSDFSGTAAKGAYFASGAAHFASGGIVSTPTLFGYSNNKTGLMGESGPEAILPLKRGSGGSLGVEATVTPVTVNIINQSGNEVQQHETTGPSGEKQIDILITNKVRDGIASGRYDKVFKQAYGVNRKGS